MVADLLDKEVKAARIFASSAESNALAIVAPASEGMDGFRTSRQVLGSPPFADAMIGAAADSVETKELGPLIAAGVHAEDQFMLAGTVMHASHAFVGKR
ncbi:MAG: hypothetical protein ACJ8FY_24240 [Gemmataceae bacterium]